MTSDIPRELRLLRIDDDLNLGSSLNNGPQYVDQEAPTHLETIFLRDGLEELAGIRSWATAIQFWKGFDQVGTIDLIVSDVKFLDGTSPLNSLAAKGVLLPLPTGISHFKSFAAIARAKGTTLGIGLHTKDPTIWEGYWNSGDHNLRYMSLLAAHEIGELAAIMGEADGLPGDGLAACWDWLKQFTVDKPNFRQAIPKALTHYRRRLKDVRMLPNDWRALRGWCMRMQAAAVESGIVPVLTDETDPGFAVLRENGKKDLIYIRSLYADVPLGKQGFAFDLVGLPAQSYSLQDDEFFFELDSEGHPKIGALIAACGDLTRDYDAAINILACFRVPAEDDVPDKLTDVKGRLHASSLATALAILLQDLKREHALVTQWRRFYIGFEWDAEHNVFTENENGQSTLRMYLRLISRKLKDDEVLTDDDVVELFRDCGVVKDSAQKGHPGAVFCLRMLAELGVAKHNPGTKEYLRGVRTFSDEDLPKFPNPPPAGFFENCGLGKAFSIDNSGLNDRSRTLRILFGHDKALEPGQAPVSDPVLERQIRQGFLLDSEKAGTKFLDAFREGRGPEWLKALCRDYALDPDQLNWRDESTWPPSLREF